MKLCETCRFGSEYELYKPCVVYREDCPLYEKEGDGMTNEKAIEELKGIKSAYSNKQQFHEACLMRSEHEALDMAIKALEQEPILDKIRAEIEKAIWEDTIVSLDGTDEVRIPRLDPDDVFEIIDKYRAESEDISKYKDIYNKGWDDGAKATYEHLKMCEEEQGGDLISRDAVRKVISVLYGRELCEIMYQINLLPSVNPQEPNCPYHVIDEDGHGLCMNHSGLHLSQRFKDWQFIQEPKTDVLDKIRAEIEGYKSTIDNAISEDELKIEGMKEAYADCLKIIDKYKAENAHKCHDCKHYTSGEYDGSCDSYICEHYSGWESEDKG